jgi:hypothetical protein
MISEGFYSIVRYTPDSARAEARNVAVLLVDELRDLARVKAAPLGQIAPRLEEHGLLDRLVVALAERVLVGELRHFDEVARLADAGPSTLSFTSPRSAAIAPDVDATLNHLYKAFVQPRRGRDRIGRYAILDRLVRACRRANVHIEPGAYVRDVLFDAVVSDSDKMTPVQVLSFDTSAQSERSTEHAAGYFLYGLNRVRATGVCVVQPPSTDSAASAKSSFDRVTGWLDDAHVEIIRPDALTALAGSMAGNDPLPLVMAQ